MIDNRHLGGLVELVAGHICHAQAAWHFGEGSLNVLASPLYSVICAEGWGISSDPGEALLMHEAHVVDK
jgi:hypothetical protein